MVQALLAQVKKETVIITGGSRRAILHCFFVESRNHPRPFYTFKGKVSGRLRLYTNESSSVKRTWLWQGEKERDGFTRRSYEEERGFLAGSIKRDHRGFWEWRYLLSVDSLFFWNKRVSECVRSRFEKKLKASILVLFTRLILTLKESECRKLKKKWKELHPIVRKFWN